MSSGYFNDQNPPKKFFEVWEEVKKNLNIKSELACQFKKFLVLLACYNSRINLFSKNTSVEKHFIDSYLGLDIIFRSIPITKTVYDFGSGNGFPGLVASIMKPENEFVLVERNQKKAFFLKIVISELGLKNVKVSNRQVCCLERSSVYLGISRAMAPFPQFLTETESITAAGGQIFLFKGKNWEREIKACSTKTLDFWRIKKAGSYIFENREFFVISCLKL